MLAETLSPGLGPRTTLPAGRRFRERVGSLESQKVETWAERAAFVPGSAGTMYEALYTPKSSKHASRKMVQRDPEERR